MELAGLIEKSTIRKLFLIKLKRKASKTCTD